MRKVTVDKIAKSLNISKSTVSKALNNTGGVSYRTKKKILDMAVKEGYTPKNETARIGIVMPNSPKFFWQTYLSEILERSKEVGLTCQHFLYENAAYPEDVLLCLESAEKAMVEVLIVGITCSVGVPAIMEKIKKLEGKMFVIFIEEIYQNTHQHYVGEHSYESAKKLTTIYLEKYPESKNFLVFSKGGHSIGSRVDGFREELEARNLNLLDVLEFPARNTAMAANVARILNNYKDRVDCIFCASDSVSDVCLAIRKIKRPNIHCIGFDCTNADMAYFDMGILKCVARQNIPKQAETVVDVAYRWLTFGEKPPHNHRFVEDYFISG